MSQGTPDPNSRNRYSLDSDEMVALFVAFLTLGSVLFWGLSRSSWDWVGGDSLLSQGEAALQGAAEGVSGEIDARLGADLSGADADDVTAGFGLGTVAPGEGNTVAPFDLFSADTENSDNARPNRSTVANEDSTAVSRGRRNLPRDADDRVVGRPERPVSRPSLGLPRQAAQPAEADAPAAPVTPLEPIQDALTFRDVPDDYWSKPFVDALSSRGLMSGFNDGTFKPDDPVTRAQLAQVIKGAFEMTSEEEAIDFNDTASDYWAYNAIQEVVKGGFMNGFPDESFQPNVSVPRVQVLTALVTGLQTEAAGDITGEVDRYVDAAKIPDWAVSKVAAATQSGLVVNYPEIDQLAPNQPATRGEVAAMVYQALVYQGRIEPVESEYLIQP